VQQVVQQVEQQVEQLVVEQAVQRLEAHSYDHVVVVHPQLSLNVFVMWIDHVPCLVMSVFCFVGVDVNLVTHVQLLWHDGLT
jgi:hypothetical protein